MKTRAQKNPGGIREAARDSWKQGGQLFEPRELLLVLAVAWLVAADQVADNKAQVEAGQQLRRLREAPHLLLRQAKPRHSGVDMNGGGQCFAARLAICGPFGGLIQAAQHGARIQLLERRRGAGQQAVEHIDRGLRQRPQRLRLAKRRHECGPAALGFERGDHRRRAKAVGVGLHYRRRLRERRQLAQFAIIAADGSEPDNRNPGRLRGRSASVRAIRAAKASSMAIPGVTPLTLSFSPWERGRLNSPAASIQRSLSHWERDRVRGNALSC